MGNLSELNLLTECPHCLDDYELPVVLDYAGGVWVCPECGEEYK